MKTGAKNMSDSDILRTVITLIVVVLPIILILRNNRDT